MSLLHCQLLSSKTNLSICSPIGSSMMISQSPDCGFIVSSCRALNLDQDPTTCRGGNVTMHRQGHDRGGWTALAWTVIFCSPDRGGLSARR